jgi:hypothetical protein
MSRVKIFFIFTAVLLFLLLLQLGQLVSLFAQEHCDPLLKKPADDKLGYSPREGRCEGRYVQATSTTLLLASLTESFENFDSNSDETLIVEWTALGNERVNLRAQGIRPRLYYRMDSVREPGSRSFKWPTSILKALEISRRDIGVVGWTRHSVGGIIRDIYVPLRIRQKENATQSNTYRVVLLPGRELTEVFYSLARVREDGYIGPFLKDGNELQYFYYPVWRAIEFEISVLGDQGIYYLEIGATLRSGAVVTVELWFYHHG